MSTSLLPFSFIGVSVSSCRSWSTHGLWSALAAFSLLPGEVVFVSRDLTSMNPTTRQRIAARAGVKTDRRVITCCREERPRARWAPTHNCATTWERTRYCETPGPSSCAESGLSVFTACVYLFDLSYGANLKAENTYILEYAGMAIILGAT